MKTSILDNIEISNFKNQQNIHMLVIDKFNYRGVGSIFRLEGHQKCKRKSKVEVTYLTTKWKYTFKDTVTLTPLPHPHSPPPKKRHVCLRNTLFGQIFCKKTIFNKMSTVNPYQSEKFAASLPQTCRKLAAHYLVRQRNLETVCRSVPLVAHFRRTTDCAPQRARLCARTGIVCEKCATIYS